MVVMLLKKSVDCWLETGNEQRFPVLKLVFC